MEPVMDTCPPGMQMVYGQCVKTNEPSRPAPQPEPYLNASEGLSGIGRAMRDKYMANQPEEDFAARFRPPVYKKGGKVKRKSSDSHMSNADHVKKHYAVGGFMHHSDHAKKLCGGGYMGKK